MLWIFKNKNIKQSNLYFLKKDFLILKKEKPYEKLNYSHFEKVYSKNKNRYFLVNFFLKKIKTKSEFYKKPKKKSWLKWVWKSWRRDTLFSRPNRFNSFQHSKYTYTKPITKEIKAVQSRFKLKKKRKKLFYTSTVTIIYDFKDKTGKFKKIRNGAMLSIFKKKKKRKKTKLRKQKKIYFKLSTTKLYGSSIFYKKKKRIKFRRKLTSFNYKKLNQIFYHTRLFKKKKLRLRKNKTILCPSTLSLNFKKKKIKKINKFTKNNLKTRYLSLSNRSVFDCLDDISMERFIVDSEWSRKPSSFCKIFKKISNQRKYHKKKQLRFNKMYFSSIFFKKNVPKGFYKRKFYDRSLFMVRKLQSKLLKWDRFGWKVFIRLFKYKMYLNRVLKKKNVPLDILVNNKLTSLYWDSIQGDYLEDISTNPPEVNKYLIPEWYSQLKFFTKLGLPRFSKSQLSLSNRTPRAYLKSTFFVGKKKMFFYKNFMDIRRYFFVKKKKTELVKQAKEIGLFLIKRKLARFSRKKHFRGFSRVKHGRFKKFLKKSFLKEKAFIYRYVKRGNRLGATYSNINRRHFFVYRSINRKIKKFKKVNFRYKKKKIRLFGFKTNKKPFSLPKGKAMGTHMFLNLISKSWFLNKKLLLYFFFKKNINLSRQFLILKKKTLGDGKKILNFKKKKLKNLVFLSKPTRFFIFKNLKILVFSKSNRCNFLKKIKNLKKKNITSFVRVQVSKQKVLLKKSKVKGSEVKGRLRKKSTNSRCFVKKTNTNGTKQTQMYLGTNLKSTEMSVFFSQKKKINFLLTFLKILKKKKSNIRRYKPKVNNFFKKENFFLKRKIIFLGKQKRGLVLKSKPTSNLIKGAHFDGGVTTFFKKLKILSNISKYKNDFYRFKIIRCVSNRKKNIQKMEICKQHFLGNGEYEFNFFNSKFREINDHINLKYYWYDHTNHYWNLVLFAYRIRVIEFFLKVLISNHHKFSPLKRIRKLEFGCCPKKLLKKKSVAAIRKYLDTYMKALTIFFYKEVLKKKKYYNLVKSFNLKYVGPLNKRYITSKRKIKIIRSFLKSAEFVTKFNR